MKSIKNRNNKYESTFYIYKFSYKFDKVIYPFLEKGTSDMTFMGRDRELK